MGRDPRRRLHATPRLVVGSFAAVFDALSHEGQGRIGYAWSDDGVRWLPECSQLLGILGASNVSGSGHGARTGVARTPQGLVQLHVSELLLGFSAFDHELPPRYYHLPSQKGT